MKKKLKEETIIFASIFKWFVLATIIGVIVGLLVTVFLNALHKSIDFTRQYPYYFVILPVAFFLISLIDIYFFPKSVEHTTDKVIEKINLSKKISFPSVVKAFFLPIITIASGGSAGKEAPCADIGAGISSLLASIFRFNEKDRRKLMICGVSAGFASVFGVPISGAIFGIEVLYVGKLFYDVLFPSLVAGIVSYQISSTLGIRYFYSPIKFVPIFTEAFFIKVVIAGIFFGICSFLLIELMRFFQALSKKINIWMPLKGLIAGVIIIVLSLIFSDKYLGLGLRTIQDSINGENIVWYAFIMKIIFTGITLNFGGIGGIVTPILFVGATSGNLFARLSGMSVSTFSAIGLVSLLAGTTNTPISASIMAIELFGPTIAPYSAMSCIISFLMTGHRSVYPSQVLAVRKSPAIDVDIGKEMEDINVKFEDGNKSLLDAIPNLFNIIKGKGKK